MNKNNQRYLALQKFFAKYKRLPSYSEMLVLFALKSKNAVFKQIKSFIEQGMLLKDKTGHLIVSKGFNGIRLLGTVEAGFPSPAEEELADSLTIDDYLITNKQATFLLKVSGTSMINAGINPGDMVLVEKGKQPKNNDIVVAQVDEEWTLKRFYKKGDNIVLMPANPRFKPIHPKNNLVLGGVVVGVVRKYC